ncbi:MAG: Nif3-like dinuclear metal center hexameric protein [Spirochaetales bacterium]|jgi:dinuclear metal center YbgI/SA1388 family protein|nr:Nif3-like dinuclear metal center hexameric protein [Spirochaetales bacterium]
MHIREIDAYYRSFLRIDDLARTDSSLNGIQLAPDTKDVRKIAFAVDACLDSFRLAADWGADMIFVHHGLFWGRDLRVTGVHYERLKFLIQNNLALYAAHLPLDMHPEVGNNAGIAAALGLRDTAPFGFYKGNAIGIQGRFAAPVPREEAAKRLFGTCAATPATLLPFGKAEVQSVGVISGGAAHEVDQAIELGLDLYITGDSAHEVYHSCQEAGINVLFAGHYQTETWGVRLTAEKTRADTGLETRFFDVPTGL